MAKVSYGGLITNLRGSIGGLTFQQTRAGNIVRLKPMPTVSTTIKQNNQNTVLADLQIKWASLSYNTKNAWDNYALTYTKIDRYGNVKTLTGFNWFFLVNSNLLTINQSFIPAPPTYSLPDSPDAYEIETSQTELLLTFDSVMTRNNQSLVIFTTPPTAISTLSFQSLLRLTKVVNLSAYDSINLTQSWQNTHEISYPPNSINDVFSVGVLAMMIVNDTGISSVARLNINSYPYEQKGIGYMMIETDFVIK